MDEEQEIEARLEYNSGMPPPSQRIQEWCFAKWFAAIAFVAGATVTFFIGFGKFAPPPPPEGSALCGNSILGGCVMMMAGTPLVGIGSALIGTAIGGILDHLLQRKARQ